MVPWGLKRAKFLGPVPKSKIGSHFLLNSVALAGMYLQLKTFSFLMKIRMNMGKIREKLGSRSTKFEGQ
jgi:hypothetical protein